ncbi:phosphotransferase [Lentibacillus saliphilus]|uniref:phosphotransferase n=1 Tax=Lentibacillus saliphilus TaxID=2737028 RepID=UPI001C303DA1
MNNDYKRGDVINDRLSSFLLSSGQIHARSIRFIKQHVYKLKTEHDQNYILKRHTHEQQVKQQRDFFQQIKLPHIAKFAVYPNGKEWIYDTEGGLWTITPFIKGRSLNYAHHNDRVEASQLLSHFHNYARHIHVPQPVKRQIFFMKWLHRLLSFKKTAHIFSEYGYNTLFHDIVQTTERHIQDLAIYPWEKLLSDAERNGLWIHGDVASHNFLKGDRTYLIDFDLLTQTCQLYDAIQLGQRFLPYIDWDLETLLSYDLAGNHKEMWLAAVIVPGDLLREWLHKLRKSDVSDIPELLSELDRVWTKRQKFLKEATNMIKSS